MPTLSSILIREAIIMAYEKDHDDVMYENYICMYCGWWICPIIDGVTDCGCEEE